MGVEYVSDLSEGSVCTFGFGWQLADTPCRCTGLTELLKNISINVLC